MMNMDLAAMYGTPGGPSAEDLEKTAQADLFVKLAAEQGIDLNQFNDEQIADLWNATFAKTAEDGEEKKEEGEEKKEEEGGEEEKKEEEKKEAAAREFASQKEWQEKVAEMDYLGRLMAHAYVQELGQIGESMEKEAGPREWAGAAKRGIESAGKYLKGKGEAASAAVGKAGRKVKEKAESEGYKVKNIIHRGPFADERKLWGSAKARRVGAAVLAAKGGAGAAGVYGVHKGLGELYGGKTKTESALDESAAELAVEKAAEAGWNAQEAAERLNALFTLDAAPESEKTAAASNVDEAIDIRSLELLEAAGYPINWA
jgi:hypothetical protein